MENNEKTLEEFIASIAKAIKEVWERIKNGLLKKWDILKKIAVKWYQLEEEKPVKIHNKHRKDFSRQKIIHQVTDRKPKHMVRKIIR